MSVFFTSLMKEIRDIATDGKLNSYGRSVYCKAMSLIKVIYGFKGTRDYQRSGQGWTLLNSLIC